MFYTHTVLFISYSFKRSKVPIQATPNQITFENPTSSRSSLPQPLVAEIWLE